MKRILIGLALILLLPALVVAQGKTAAPAGGETLLLSFVPDGSNLTVTTTDKKTLVYPADIAEGDAIPAGAVVTTGPDTTAELKLRPNGTIIKLAFNTKFSFAGTGPDRTQSGKTASVFTLLAGKIRTVAAKGANYNFSSNTAVCGVRGTDFSFDIGADETTQALLLVQKGLIQFDKLDATGAVLGSIPVAAGEAADTFAAQFASFKFSADQFAKEFGDMGFKKLNENDVPQGENGQAENQGGQEQGQGGGKAAAESPIMKWLGEVLGFELGSVTINNTTYSKVVVQPNLQFGKLKLGLYLPVIYSSDLFSPSDWYHPAGNDEWDFGSRYWGSNNVKGAEDFATDLALKIKYLEYGEQFKDPFFVKVGNLEDLTIGHGLIMRNYANDSEFPAVRRVGANLGVDAGGGGFEALTNDLADPTIFGARVYVRPIPNFKLAFGISGVIDTAPGADVNIAGDNVPNNLMLLGGGVDLDLPVIQSDLLGIRWFADGAAAAPYIKQDSADGATTVASGLKSDLVYDNGAVKNWGAATGLIGNVLFIDWRLEFRYFTGIFTPSLFDTTYDQKRAQYAVQYASYVDGTASVPNAPDVMGIYGEGGFHILNKKLNLTVGYMWPWSPNGTLSSNLANNNDEFHAKVVVLKGLIPVVDIAGFISYDRRSLAQSIQNGSFTFIDENTSFSGELDMPIPKTENLDLAIMFSTVPVYEDGVIVLNSKGIPEMKPSISIETRIHF